MVGLTSSPGPGEVAASSRSDARPSEVPQRADDVVLIGEMAGSGYREPPSLARRGDGQVVQLTRLLHQVPQAPLPDTPRRAVPSSIRVCTTSSGIVTIKTPGLRQVGMSARHGHRQLGLPSPVILEYGNNTSGLRTCWALRIRVSMSAIVSIICVITSLIFEYPESLLLLPTLGNRCGTDRNHASILCFDRISSIDEQHVY